MQLQFAGETWDVLKAESPEHVERLLLEQQPPFFAYDTESTGLHIIKDVPFLGGIGWLGTVIVFPTTPEYMQGIVKWSKLPFIQRVYAHNTTYDMHMMANIIGKSAPLQIPAWGDTMGLCRFIFESVSADKGGDSLQLKQILKKYVDENANKYEKELKAWLSNKRKSDLKLLYAQIQHEKGKKGWSQKRIDSILAGNETADDEVMRMIEHWKQHHPEPTYFDVPDEIMLPYLATDIMGCVKLVYMALPIIKERNLVPVMEREFKLLKVTYKMERRGKKVDREYLKQSYTKIQKYIESLYTELHELLGAEVSVGQHARIKNLLSDLVGCKLPSSDSAQLIKLARHSDPKIKRAAVIIKKLRTCEKWIKTYVSNILERSEYDGRFYTQLNQFSPVSGRFSGDAQQFPKDSLRTIEGDELKKNHQEVPLEEDLFNPRRAFLPTRKYTYFLDYSQVELRVQSHYTLFMGGDLNLCRAYMPFKCVHYETGEAYDYKTREGRLRWIELKPGAPKDKHWEDLLKEGWSVWVMPDKDNQVWKPTDVHGATSTKALDLIFSATGDPMFDRTKMSKSELKEWRNIGKRFNFMRNYGGGDAKAAETLEIELEHAKAMNQGYSESFPLVVQYQKMVEKMVRERGYVVNLYGRRYYLFGNNVNRAYTLGNHLIQGSCADALKEKMIEIDEYLVANNLEDDIAIDLCVHDELQFDCDEGVDEHIAVIKSIMEDTPKILVPIVAEVERTETTWADKKAYNLSYAS